MKSIWNQTSVSRNVTSTASDSHLGCSGKAPCRKSRWEESLASFGLGPDTPKTTLFVGMKSVLLTPRLSLPISMWQVRACCLCDGKGDWCTWVQSQHTGSELPVAGSIQGEHACQWGGGFTWARRVRSGMDHLLPKARQDFCGAEPGPWGRAHSRSAHEPQLWLLVLGNCLLRFLEG